MFCTCSRICSIATFISTAIALSSKARPTWSPGCWPRAATPGPGSPGACRVRRPLSSRRSISSRWARSRASSSATSMRIANAAASVSASLLERLGGARTGPRRSPAAPRASARRSAAAAAGRPRGPTARPAPPARAQVRDAFAQHRGEAGNPCARAPRAARPGRPRGIRRQGGARRASHRRNAPRHHYKGFVDGQPARLGEPVAHHGVETREAVELLRPRLRPGVLPPAASRCAARPCHGAGLRRPDRAVGVQAAQFVGKRQVEEAPLIEAHPATTSGTAAAPAGIGGTPAPALA